MAKTDRTVLISNDQEFGQVADPNKLETQITHAFDKIDENDNEFINHKKQVDPTSADTTRDKHVSNNDLKGLQDQITTNLDNLTNHKKQVDPTSSDTTRDKHVANNDLKTLQDQITTNDTASVNRDNTHKNAVVLDHPDQSVTTAKIKDYAVTSNKIANGAVSRNQLDPTLFEQTANASKFQEIDAQFVDIVINVKKYGAIGDGIADDSDAIQAAINANYTNAYTTILLPEKHRITKKIAINKNSVTLIGNGIAKSEIICDGVNAYIEIKSVDNSNIYENVFKNIGIRGINGALYGVKMEKVSQFKWTDISFSNLPVGVSALSSGIGFIERLFTDNLDTFFEANEISHVGISQSNIWNCGKIFNALGGNIANIEIGNQTWIEKFDSLLYVSNTASAVSKFHINGAYIIATSRTDPSVNGKLLETSPTTNAIQTLRFYLNNTRITGQSPASTLIALKSIPNAVSGGVHINLDKNVISLNIQYIVDSSASSASSSSVIEVAYGSNAPAIGSSLILNGSGKLIGLSSIGGSNTVFNGLFFHVSGKTYSDEGLLSYNTGVRALTISRGNSETKVIPFKYTTYIANLAAGASTTDIINKINELLTALRDSQHISS